MLQLMAAAGALSLGPKLLSRVAAATPVAALPPYGFLTADELAILDAAATTILPGDGSPGAREIGVVGYVQSLLSFLPGSDANCDRYTNAADVGTVQQKAVGQYLGCPTGGDVNGDGAVDGADVRAAEAAVFRARPMFAGGPFSGRNPQPHFPVGDQPCSVCHGPQGEGGKRGGAAGSEPFLAYPPNTFRQFLPLNRLQRLSWRARLLGPRGVPEVAGNPLLADLPEVDLRRRYRQGLAALDASARQTHGKPFVDLEAEQRHEILRQPDLQRFLDLLHRHVLQGTLCNPEYGGNHNRLGWQLVGFDGDSQPLGYTIYDESAPGFYRERPDKPNSGPNPDEDCSGFSNDMKRFLDGISRVTGGGPLAEPYCFEVDE